MKLTNKIDNLQKLIEELESENLDLDLAVEKFQKTLEEAKEIFKIINTKEKEILVLEKETEKLLEI